MRWSGATGAIARCKRVSTGCGRKRRSARVWRWICGVKPKPKAGNKPLYHCIVRELDKPGRSATVSKIPDFFGATGREGELALQVGWRQGGQDGQRFFPHGCGITLQGGNGGLECHH